MSVTAINSSKRGVDKDIQSTLWRMFTFEKRASSGVYERLAYGACRARRPHGSSAAASLGTMGTLTCELISPRRNGFTHVPGRSCDATS